MSPPPAEPVAAEDIAIVGMSCLFPGADSPTRFWQNIVGKVDAISEAPPDWQPELFYDPAGPKIDRSYTNRGGFLGELCRFNPLKYGVPPSSVEGAEPDHFIALRCAYEALEDAGVPQVAINREKTGVIMGRGIFVNRGWVAVFQRTFAVEQVIGVLRQLEPHRSEADLDVLRKELKRGLPPANADTFPGLVHSALVGRIANRLDLKGPAYTVDAACSSTLLAVEHGIRELRAGRCDCVLAGGTQVSTPAPVHIMFCHLDALSRAGRIAPFSAEAAGTVLGQGCGLLVLKRRSDAERDGNRIYALLKSVGVSSDGKGAGLLAPRTEGQQLAIRRAYEDANLSPDTVRLVEAHGTGIPLGDGVEIGSLAECFGGRRGPHADVALGSVKSMIGHLVPASGAASLIKTALALHHRVLPPTLHAETPSPELELDKTPFYLSTETRPWIHGDPDVPRRAGVNAFGFGGINAHALLEEYRGDEQHAVNLERDWPYELVVVSAADRAALRQRVEQLQAWIEQSSGLELLDVAASCAQEQGASRLAIVAKSVADLIKKLGYAARLLAEPERQRIQDRAGVFWYAEPLAAQGRVALVFPGEGSQYPLMLSELARQFPEVRREFDLTSRAFEQQGKSLARVLFPLPEGVAAAETEMFEMETAVASVTAAARGMWRLLQSLNVQADAVVGHSSGEYAALLAAGAYRHQDDEAMVRAILAGTQSATELTTSNLLPRSVLVSVGGVPEDVLSTILREHPDVTVAIDNCPHQRILVGSEAAMSSVLGRLQGQGGLCQRLAWDRPYHTSAFEPACPIVERYFQSLELCAPERELWSCATAAPMPRQAESVRELAVRQWRSPVRFRETIAAMHAAGVRVFMEVGPRGNLSAFIADTLANQPHAAVPLDVPNKHGLEQLCRALGMLAAHGVPLKLDELFRRRTPKLLNLTGEPFKAPPPDPRLRLELPLLEVAPDVVQQWQSSTPQVAPKAVEPLPPTPAPVPTPPRNGAAPPAAQRTNGAAPLPQSASRGVLPPAPSTPANRRPAPSSAVQSLHNEFQRTMQQFLQTQESIAELWGRRAGEGNSSNGLAAKPQAVVEPAPRIAPVREAAPASPVATIAPTAPATAAASPVPAARRLPFMEAILEHRPAERLVVECELSVEKHPFLRDHTFFGRQVSDRNPHLIPLPVMPLAMTLELLAEAAATLFPAQQVTAVSKIRVARWLPFPGQGRRVRVIATAENDTLVAARVVEADGDAEYEIAAANIELGARQAHLGAGRLPRLAQQAPPWPAEDLYGKILYHGPAFQGIEVVEDWGPRGVRTRVRQPDGTKLLPDGQAADLVLPVALVDTASQIPGLVNGNWEAEGAWCTLAFPNEIERLEIASAAWNDEPLVAVATVDQSSGKLCSDTEITTASGQTVLRYLGKVEEIVDFPLPLYRQAFNPRESFCGRSLNGLFAGVPGIEQVEVREVVGAGERLLVKSFWATVLSRLILDARERSEFDRLKLPPVAMADWLLGRLAAKEALRAHLRFGGCLGDLQLTKDEHDRPLALVDGPEIARVSYSHKTLKAVAVAGPLELAGIGIDCEPLQPLPDEVLVDAFTAAERELLADAARATGEALHAWHRAGWGAKEAVGKALGRGVLGGPRCIPIAGVDPASRRISLQLAGAMAAAFPAYTAGSDRAGRILNAFWREHEQQALVLALLITIDT